MDSDTDSNSSQEERGDHLEEFANRLTEFMRNLVREPGQTVEVNLGDGCRLGASIEVDDGGHVVDEMRVNFSYRPTEDRQVVEQGGIHLRDIQQLVGLLRIANRLGVLHGGIRQGRVQRRDQLRQRIRLELCRRCGKIHRAGACTGSRPRAVRRERQRACPICLEAMGAAGGDDVVLRCGHVFHYDCVAPWCRRRNTCPVCRSRLEQLD